MSFTLNPMNSKDSEEGRINTLKDVKANFGFKPLVKRKALVVSSENMEPTTKAIGMGKGLLGMQGKMGDTS